jgi:hypothetical protein
MRALETKATLHQSLFQCLYSQCDTAHFSSALHHTISQCSSVGGEIIFLVPPILNHDGLRRREAEYLAGIKPYSSGSADGFLIQSAYPAQSAHNYLTQSVADSYYLIASSTSVCSALNTTAGPAGTSATPTEDYAAAGASTNAGPPLYTGNAPETGPTITIPILVSMAAFYIAL